MLAGVEVLALNDEIAAIAELPVNERAMPGPAIEGDALHVSVCPVHGVEYVMTWNQKHLANPKKRGHLTTICSRTGSKLRPLRPPRAAVHSRDHYSNDTGSTSTATRSARVSFPFSRTIVSTVCSACADCE